MAYTPLPTLTSGTIDLAAVVFTGNIASNLLDSRTGEAVTLTKATNKLQGGAITSGDIDQILYFDLGGDYHVRNLPMGYVDIRWWPVAADGVTDDSAFIIKAIATKRKVFFPDKTFKLNTGIATDYLNILADKTTFIFDGAVTPCIKVAGTPSVAYVIDAAADLGRYYVESTTLAAVAKKGDMVLVRNDQSFTDTTQDVYDNYRGETKEVFKVVGTKVYFTTALHDTYTNGATDNFRAYVITPGYCNIEGDFTLTTTQTNYTESNQTGINLYLNYKPFLRNVKVNNCNHANIWVNSCFQADLVVNVSTGLRTNNGYGVAVINATCESRFSGTWSNCRHCLTMGGGDSDLAGIPHANKIYDVIASGGDGNAMIDCHPPTGLVEFENIMCIGGTLNEPEQPDLRPSGINAGGRNVIVRGLTGIELGRAVVVRPGADIQRLDVCGVNLFHCYILIESTQAGILKQLDVSDVKGDLTGPALALSNSTGTMDMLAVANCQVTCSHFLLSGPDFKLPAVITFSNVKATGQGNTGAGYAIQLNDDLQDEDLGVNTVRVENCLFEQFKYAIRLSATKNLNALVLSGNVFKDNENHIFVAGTTNGTPENPITRIKLFQSNGDHFSGTNEAPTSALGILYMQRSYHKICNAIVDNYVCNDQPHFFSDAARVDYLTDGMGVASGFTSVAKNVDGYEIIAGSVGSPLIVRGTGTPEGIVPAKYSTLYMRKDAAGVYMKGTDTGNTGWVELVHL